MSVTTLPKGGPHHSPQSAEQSHAFHNPPAAAVQEIGEGAETPAAGWPEGLAERGKFMDSSLSHWEYNKQWPKQVEQSREIIWSWK